MPPSFLERRDQLLARGLVYLDGLGQTRRWGPDGILWEFRQEEFPGRFQHCVQIDPQLGLWMAPLWLVALVESRVDPVWEVLASENAALQSKIEVAWRLGKHKAVTQVLAATDQIK